MNFEEWFNQISGESESYGFKGAARDGWEACKQEVLKIIKSKHPKDGQDSGYEIGWDAACISIEEEVEIL